MKKIFSMLMAVALVGLMTSCQKDNDGIYKPGKKISKITNTDGEDVDVDTWNWNGNLVESVVTKSGDRTETINYTYEGKKLVKGSNESGTEYFTISYVSKKIDKIEAYTDGKLESVINVVYDGKQIKEVKITGEEEEYDDKAFKHSMSYRAMCMVMPSQAVEAIHSLRAKSLKNGAKGTQTITAAFEWNGKNVATVSAVVEGMTMKMSYAYDDKTNPMHDFVGAVATGDYTGYCSVNNPVEVTMTIVEFNNYSESEKLTYEYNGKYPTKITTDDGAITDIEYL